MMIGLSRTIVVPRALLCCLILVAGCERGIVEGRVVNEHGETLPGVVITIRGGEPESVSTSLGTYRLIASPGPVVLDFVKTGYTPGEARALVVASQRIKVEEVNLWQLPQSAGVYISERAQYREMTRVTPRRFALANGELVYASRRDPELEVSTGMPLIIAYRMPRYNVRLSRLAQEEATQGAGKVHRFPVWTPAGSQSVKLVSIDPAKQVLLKVELLRDLDPGVYALHWGALDGEAAIESSVFMFRVVPVAAANEGE